MDSTHLLQQQVHFLIVAYPLPGHINPALDLARRLVSITDAFVTFSTAASAHCRLFPNAPPPEHDGTKSSRIAYIPYPDNEDTHNNQTNANDAVGSTPARGLSSVISTLTACDRRVTCVIYTINLTWVAYVARDHKIPSIQFWIQPATALSIYYHYFHGYDALIAAHINDPTFTIELPGLCPLQIRDLPSFITCTTPDDFSQTVLSAFSENFKQLDMDPTEPKPKILVNSYDELEPEALVAVEKLDLISIGPISTFLTEINSEIIECGLITHDGKEYMNWLDKQAEKSVVYVSFGSIYVLKKKQIEEIFRGLKMSGRPYLWVVRKDNRLEGIELEEDEEKTMVVEWCSQVQVLSHPSIGCFVTHCGWNSTMESLMCGVPTVGVPQWSDQTTNAMLMEKIWGNGVRVEVNKEGVLEGEELRRCLDLVMEDGERKEKLGRNAELWREKSKEAVKKGSSSDQNLKTFVKDIAAYDQSSH